MPDLGIQNVQFVMFKSSVDGLTAGAIYRTFTGSEPDNTQSNRSPNPAQPFLSFATGTIGERIYTAQVSPGRVDLQIVHPDRPLSGPWGWKLEDGLRILDEHVEKIIPKVLATIGPTVRLAVNLHHLRNCSSAAEANLTIRERVNIPQLANATDVNLQFNRRVASSVKGITLNRLLRFATSLTREFAIGPDGQTSLQGPERYMATMLLDVNTVPTGVEIDTKTGAAIFSEIAVRARRMSQVATIDALDVDDAGE